MLIGELADATSVSARLLRYYEKQGLLEPARDASGYRRYADTDVTVVRQIRALLAAGLSTDDIRVVLPCARGGQPDLEMCPMLRARLGRHLADLDLQIETLRRSRNTVAGYLADG